MNDANGFQSDACRDDPWAAGLASLRRLPSPQGNGPGGEENFLDGLAMRARRRAGPARHLAGRFSRFWETALISLITLLLAWDLLRIIRQLLG